MRENDKSRRGQPPSGTGPAGFGPVRETGGQSGPVSAVQCWHRHAALPDWPNRRGGVDGGNPGGFRCLDGAIVRLDPISAFAACRALFLLPTMVLHYAGSEPMAGHYWHGAFAENVHMGGFMDQRDTEHCAAAFQSAALINVGDDDRPGSPLAGSFEPAQE